MSSDDLQAQIDACRERAYRLLEPRPHSAFELRRKLLARGFGDDVLDTVLADLERFGMIDDLQFARAYCESKLTGSRPVGPVRLRSDLSRRGVSDDIVRQALAEIAAGDEGGELARAESAAQSKLRLIRDTSDRRVVQGKLYRFLAGRGFSADVCRQAAENALTDSR